MKIRYGNRRALPAISKVMWEIEFSAMLDEFEGAALKDGNRLDWATLEIHTDTQSIDDHLLVDPGEVLTTWTELRMDIKAERIEE